MGFKKIYMLVFFPVSSVLFYLFNSIQHKAHSPSTLFFLDLALIVKKKVHCVGVGGEVSSQSLVSTTRLLQAVGSAQLLSTASTLHLNLFWKDQILLACNFHQAASLAHNE